MCITAFAVAIIHHFPPSALATARHCVSYARLSAGHDVSDGGGAAGGRAYVGGGQHVLGVHQRAEQTHQLHGAAQLGVRVTDHVLDDQVDEKDVLRRGQAASQNR